MSKKSDDAKLYALLGVLLPIIGFVIIMATDKKDKFAMFYGKQGLVLGIAAIVISVINSILWWSMLGHLIMWLLWLGWIILWILGIVYSLSGKETDIPVVGPLAKKIKI